MTSRTISAENLGPITELGFALDSPGVTVLVAPNGSGKSILLDAVQAAARGEGKLPLRDRTKRGKVEAFGAVITIGGTCRHTGEFEVTNLEGRFDLAALVDPRIKSPALADNARIKALVSLTGVESSVDLFRSHEAFANFDRIVKSGSTQTDDLVEMARRIKGDYDEAARSAEDEAERETGHADGMKPPTDLDLKGPSDASQLQAAYDSARDALTRLASAADESARQQAQQAKAKEAIAVLKASDPAKKRAALVAQQLEDLDETEALRNELNALRSRAKAIESRIDALDAALHAAGQTLKAIDSEIESLRIAETVVAESAIAAPSLFDIERAQTAVFEARAAIEQGALIRQAIKDQEAAQKHRKAASVARDRALTYRDAGKATDEVLSSCIKCPQLRVESDGKSARLVADTERGKSITYHDLSDGEKWTIAIDIGADQVGKGGLLVISQVGWEGIDGKNRQIIHQRAVEREVYILTAEASADPEALRAIVPTPFAEASVV